MHWTLKKTAITAAAVLVTTLVSTASQATVFTGDIFYTRFLGEVKKTTFTYDDTVPSFSIGVKTLIKATGTADGITGNPADSSRLIVGGQGSLIHNVEKDGSGFTSHAAGTSTAFHLEVASSSLIYATGIPGGTIGAVTLDGSGNYVSATGIGPSATSAESSVTQIIDTPSGFYYTSSGPGGFGTFGTISIGATYTASRMYGAGGSVSASTLPAAHGGVYDPFSGNIILFGDGRITQLDLAGTIIGDLALPSQFDQGTVDGLGHIFAANNSDGKLYFIDYSTTKDVDTKDFLTSVFLDTKLDDIAPLVGKGTTELPEPGTLAIFALGLAGLGAMRRRRTA